MVKTCSWLLINHSINLKNHNCVIWLFFWLVFFHFWLNTLQLAALYYVSPYCFHYFLWELIYTFLILSVFSRTHLGHKTRAVCVCVCVSLCSHMTFLPDDVGLWYTSCVFHVLSMHYLFCIVSVTYGVQG